MLFAEGPLCSSVQKREHREEGCRSVVLLASETQKNPKNRSVVRCFFFLLCCFETHRVLLKPQKEASSGALVSEANTRAALQSREHRSGSEHQSGSPKKRCSFKKNPKNSSVVFLVSHGAFQKNPKNRSAVLLFCCSAVLPFCCSDVLLFCCLKKRRKEQQSDIQVKREAEAEAEAEAKAEAEAEAKAEAEAYRPEPERTSFLECL